MEKKYIIKDARNTLAHQLEATGTMEKEPMSESPITNAKGLSAAIPKDSEGYCTVYKLDCSDGLGLMTVYQVYPGIQLIYNDFEAAGCVSAPVIKCKKTPRKKCSFVAEVKEKR